jgi:hypothetical protein
MVLRGATRFIKALLGILSTPEETSTERLAFTRCPARRHSLKGYFARCHATAEFREFLKRVSVTPLNALSGRMSRASPEARHTLTKKRKWQGSVFFSACRYFYPLVFGGKRKRVGLHRNGLFREIAT